jgi:hypothetical protein
LSVSDLELRRQLDVLQGELSTRKSTLHFAHAGMSILCSLIIAGTAGKLVWDSSRHWWIGTGVGVFAVIVWLYGWLQYRLGRRHLGLELEGFERLQTLRQTLKLDDPGALLPP